MKKLLRRIPMWIVGALFFVSGFLFVRSGDGYGYVMMVAGVVLGLAPIVWRRRSSSRRPKAKRETDGS